MSPAVPVIAVALLAVVLVEAWRRRRPWPSHPFRVGSPEADASTLEALRRTGADLSKEVDVHFRLYFTSRDAATRAGELTRHGTRATSVEHSADGREWLCRIVARLVPTEMEIRDNSVRMGAVAATTGGRYEGWEAAATRREGDGSSAHARSEPHPSSGRAVRGSFPVAPGPINLLIKWFVAVVGYISVPIGVYLTDRVGPAVDIMLMTAKDDRTMPDELRAYLVRVEKGLVERGFGAPTRAIIRPSGLLKTYTSLLESNDRHTLASAIVTRTARGRTMATTMFRSEFDDGAVLISTNNQRRRRLPRPRGQMVVDFPDIDPTALYEVHRFRATEYAQAAEMREVSRHPDPLTYHVRETAESHLRSIETGYFRRAADGGLRPTWRGAVGLVWRTKFPWLQRTRKWDGRERAAIMTRYRAQ